MSDHFDHKLERRLETRAGSDGDEGGRVRRLELISGTGRRRQWSSDDKARIVVESLAPGATVSDVARRHGMSPQQLFAWRREARAMFRDDDAGVARPASPSRPVPLSSGPAPAFAEVVLAAPAGSPPTPPLPKEKASTIEIVIGDVTVRVIGPVASEAITAALRAVRRSS